MEGQDWNQKRAEYDQLAGRHVGEHQYDAALKWYRLSAAILAESIVQSRGFVHLELPAAFDNMARAHHFMGEYEYAVLYYSQSVMYNRTLGRFEHIFDQRIAIAHSWCTLGELKATAAALEHAPGHGEVVATDDHSGYSELMEALAVLQTALRDRTETSDQQKANYYALKRHVYRLTGKPGDAKEMHKLCARYGGGEYDTIGHGLLMVQQDMEGACGYLQDLLGQPNVNQFKKRDAHNAMGRVLVQKGQVEEARKHHQNALKLCLQQHCPNAAMLTYYYLGQVDPHAQDEHYQEGLLLAEKLKARAVCLRNRSPEALLTSGSLDRMRELYEHRLALAQQDLFAIADARVKLNEVNLAIGSYDSQYLLERTHQAIKLVGRLQPGDSGVTEMLAKCHSQVGEAYYRLGESRKAIDSFDTAIRYLDCIKLGNETAIVTLRVQKARLIPASREDLKEALEVLEKVGGHNPSNLQQNLKAKVHLFLLSVIRKVLLGPVSDSISIEESMTQFAQCKQAAEESFDILSLVQAHIMMADVHNAMSYRFIHNDSESEEYGLQDDFCEDVGLSRTSSLADVRKVNIQELATKFNKQRLYHERSKGLALPSVLQKSVPWMDFAAQEGLAAEEMHEAHLEFARRRGGPLALASSLTSIGVFYKNMYMYIKARKFLEEAALLHSDFLFGIQAISDTSLEYMHIMRTTHINLLACIAEHENPAVHEEGLVWAERLRARTLLHAMQFSLKKDPLIEIPQFDTDKQAAVKCLKEISLSSPGVVFVEYALLDDRLLIWVVKQGSIVLRQRKYYHTWSLVDAGCIQMDGTLYMPKAESAEMDEKLRSTGRLIGYRRNGVRAFINGAVENIKNAVRADEWLNLLGDFLLGPIIEDLPAATGDQFIVFIPHEL